MLNVKYILHHYQLTKLYVKHYIFDYWMTLRPVKTHVRISTDQLNLQSKKTSNIVKHI